MWINFRVRSHTLTDHNLTGPSHFMLPVQPTYFVNIIGKNQEVVWMKASFGFIYTLGLLTLWHLFVKGVYVKNSKNTRCFYSVGKGGDCTWRSIIKQQKPGGATACSHFEEIPPGLKLDHKGKILHCDYTRTTHHNTVPNCLSHSISVCWEWGEGTQNFAFSWIAWEANNSSFVPFADFTIGLNR